jgi:fatty-acyl-CoA synthase/long-chain acyl-CoA synthetase
MIGALSRFGAQSAIQDARGTLGYAQLVGQSNRLARVLVDLGVKPGDPVALMLSNRTEWAIADQAIIRAGAAKVPINNMLMDPEIAFILGDCGARVALVDSVLAPAARAAGIPHVIEVGRNWDAAISSAESDEPPEVDVQAEDVALILYTGGTTGRQKGVIHTQASLAANALSHVIEIGLQDDERMLLTAPLAHSAGFLLQAGLIKGAVIVLEPRFDPVAVLDRIQTDEITFLFLVPTMIYRLLDAAEAVTKTDSSLRTILYGAAPITVERLEQGLRRFGPVFMQLYGQSEAPNFLTRLTREEHDPSRPHLLKSSGRPAAMVEIVVLDEDGNPVGPDVVGEICAKAPYVTTGYLGLEAATAVTLAGGWLHTGDIGSIDSDGYVYLLDRKNDMVISGGMNVYTSEVEQVIAACDGVAHVAVAGVPHPDWGEAVVAFVVPASGYDEASVVARCRSELATYKRPKAIRVLSVLPLTSVGKVDKKLLRTEWGGWAEARS